MGSSPLTRGKPDTGPATCPPARLIPAHAGKTYRMRWPHARQGAHPRSRGENMTGGSPAASTPGSSPLTRGKLPLRVHARSRRRLIPAHAGKTDAALPRPLRKRAHPRSRGENSASALAFSRPHGSSPLTRGKRQLPQPRPRAGRLIPAHAGKTWSPLAPMTATWAHPRSRGENWCGCCRLCRGGGSSPLTRGKRRGGFVRFARCRLIPAHAGKTALRGLRAAGRPAHPRSRGENGNRSQGSARSAGSSPLTRGKLPFGWACSTTSRLIPAHAGKTPSP